MRRCGDLKATLIVVGIRALPVILFVYRQVVQDKRRVRWRNLTEDIPELSSGQNLAALPPGT